MDQDGFRAGAVAYHTLQYALLGPGEFTSRGGGHTFRFTYRGLPPRLITIFGRHLLRIWDQIALPRLPWIRQADRDVFATAADHGEPIITRIEVTDWVRLQE